MVKVSHTCLYYRFFCQFNTSTLKLVNLVIYLEILYNRVALLIPSKLTISDVDALDEKKKKFKIFFITSISLCHVIRLN